MVQLPRRYTRLRVPLLNANGPIMGTKTDATGTMFNNKR